MANAPLPNGPRVPSPLLRGAVFTTSTTGNSSTSDIFIYADVVESPVPSSTILSTRQSPAEPLPASGLEGTFRSLSLEQKLCETCKLLDFQKVFYSSTDEYKFPPTPANFVGMFGNRFCWFLFHMKKEKNCQFCHLIMSTLRLNPRFEGLDDGIVVASRISLYSKESDVSLPNFHFLRLGVSEGESLHGPVSYGYAIGMLGMHKILLPNTVKASLKHFYPWLPPGMVPMSTTNEQATKWDAWRLETATEYEVSVRKYDSDVVSMKLITGWLKCCEEEHTTWCVEKMTRKIAAVPGFRVVDVVSGNIVEQPEGCRYLALSYVWGEAHRQKDYLRLLKANYSQLTEAGGLVKQLSHLPNTIRDAILLCQRLDERHLWIDSLCIIQDSEEDKLGQIMQMDAIYLHAVLTIVAAAGSDANAGLPGIGPSLSRKVAPATSIGGLDLVAIPEDGEFELRNSKWNSRAWTFQERILSKRMLRFTSESVTFECQSACWREDFIVAGPDADRFRLADQERKEQEVRQNFHDIISADVLQFEKMMPRLEWSNDFKNIWTVIYGPLVENYTKRQLTMESDILNAFKGIEGALKRSLGDFYWGLPLYLLGQSLGWIANTGDLKRRAEFPTFSWAGWVFVEGNWGAYPDYLTGPFPGFVVFNDDGNIVYWNGDCQDDIYVGIYEWHDQLLYPSSTEMANEWDGILAQTVGNVMNAEIEIPLSSLVFFWTSVAAIEPFIYEMPEEEEEDGDEWSENRKFEEGRRRRTTILEGTTVIRHFEKGILVDGDLEPEEMKSVSIQLESCEVELVYIGHSSISSGKWCLILVSWKDGIARRILPQVLFHVDASDWEAKHIRRRLVVLG